MGSIAQFINTDTFDLLQIVFAVIFGIFAVRYAGDPESAVKKKHMAIAMVPFFTFLVLRATH